MKAKRRSIIAVLALVLTLVAACVPTDAPPTSTPVQPTATSAPETAVPPEETDQLSEVGPTDTPSDTLGPIGIEPAATFPVGVFAARDRDWVLAFDDDGSYTAWQSGAVVSAGTFSTQANELTWETDSYCDPGNRGKATYTWTLDNETLLFQVQGEDGCSNRLAMLDDIAYDREEEWWDLVVIGDSSLWGVARTFAAQIEADVGVKVLGHDATVGGLSAGKVLQALETGQSPNARLAALPDLLRDAEVVVMFANPEDSMDAEKLQDFGSCIDVNSPESPGHPEESCSLEAFERYTADLAAIWAEILELRAGQPTVLRATDIYNPVVGPWNEAGVFDACTECWENQSHAARLAAQAYNIPFLSRYDAFNGTNHSEDPREKGFIFIDGSHLSGLGQQFTAELLAQMGYEPMTLP